MYHSRMDEVYKKVTWYILISMNLASKRKCVSWFGGPRVYCIMHLVQISLVTQIIHLKMFLSEFIFLGMIC